MKLKPAQQTCGRGTRTRMSTRSPWIGALLGISLLVPSLGQANQTGDSRSVTFHGTLKSKPCYIDDDGDIYVHFGNVGVNKVDGEHYIQDVPYTLRCEDANSSETLKMSLKGSQAGFEESALQTDVNGLGIRILRDGEPLKINDAIAINYEKPPKLQAVPVQQSGVALTARDFSATATLLTEYE